MLEKVRDFFGIKYLIPYNKASKKPFGFFRAITDVNFERTVDEILLEGGHFEGALDSEPGQPQNTLTTTIKEYPDFAFELFEGADVTTTAAEATGFVGTIANKKGTSVFDATTGIASVAIKPTLEANLKGIRYVFSATGPNTVDIYVHGDATFLGIDAVVVEGVVVPSTGGTVDVDVLGITITGGSGTVAFVTADTAEVDVRPIHNGFRKIKVGGTDSDTANFGLICVFPKKADGAQYWIDIHNVVAKGMPWKGVTREFSEFTLNGTPLVDCSENAIYTLFSKLPDPEC